MLLNLVLLQPVHCSAFTVGVLVLLLAIEMLVELVVVWHRVILMRRRHHLGLNDLLHLRHLLLSEMRVLSHKVGRRWLEIVLLLHHRLLNLRNHRRSWLNLVHFALNLEDLHFFHWDSAFTVDPFVS